MANDDDRVRLRDGGNATVFIYWPPRTTIDEPLPMLLSTGEERRLRLVPVR
jgi:hypothetical protein